MKNKIVELEKEIKKGMTFIYYFGTKKKKR